MDDTFKNIANQIVSVIHQLSRNAEEAIDEKYKVQRAHSTFLLSKIFTLLNVIVNHTDQNQVNDESFESQILLWQACNTMMASLQLIRQGYPLEPQFLMRTALESSALAIGFHINEKAYQQYLNGKLDGKGSIKFAKKIIPELGEIWGNLSAVTHPSKKTTGNNYSPEGETLIIGGGYNESLSHRTLFNFALLNYMLLNIWKGAEYVFYDFDPKHFFWHRNEDIFTFKVDESITFISSSVLKDFKEALELSDKI